MNITRRIASAAAETMAILYLLAVLTGCEHRELCYDHSHWVDLHIEFDWSDCPDADPHSMVTYLFPVDGGIPRCYEFGNINGGIVRAPAGAYNAVAFNGETETILETGDTFDSFMLTTDDEELLAPLGRGIEEAPRLELTRDQPVRKAPDKVWSARSENVYVAPGVRGQKIRFTPNEATVRYHVVIRLEDGIGRAPGVSAALSTLSEGYSPASAHPVGRHVTVPIALRIADASTLKGDVDLFGHCHDGTEGKLHVLSLYTSNKYYYNYDVTDQIHDAQNPHEVTIEIEGVKLPEVDTGGGMIPDINDWTDIIDTDINMN
ncbi:DUF5119 domain-containing protein [uncultured Muribaculum sp.]|uniref:DUF5119 domain-containing protein n=1 Tax=uncultured Muribaculum sp. TaxID=1918613 RepID=UPI0025FE8FC0|nr:DUF5119 domain-containing protein [uncultured Muribaculum sp.]